MIMFNNSILLVLLFNVFNKVVNQNTETLDVMVKEGESCNTEKYVGIYIYILDCPQYFIYSGEDSDVLYTASSTPVMCCIKLNYKPNQNIEIPKTNLNRISAKKCIEYKQFCDTKKTSITSNKPQPVKRNIVAYGMQAKFKEFPHMAILFYNDFAGCGGSLISEKFILTAAHCEKLDSIGLTSISLGIINLNDRTHEQNFKIKKFIKHDEYHNYNNDIALIELDANVKFNEYIRPICLPLISDYQFTEALVTGWGASSKNSLRNSPDLLKGAVKEFDHDNCFKTFSKNTQIKAINKTMHLCAGSNNKVSACQGDSGGPLQLEHNEFECMFIEIAVVSLGFQICGSPGIPSIYTNIFPYLDWIENIVWPNNK